MPQRQSQCVANLVFDDALKVEALSLLHLLHARIFRTMDCGRRIEPEPGAVRDEAMIALDTVSTTMTAAKEAGHARQATEGHDSWE